MVGPLFRHNRLIGDCSHHVRDTMLPVARSVCLMMDWPMRTCRMATMFSRPHIHGYFLWSHLKSVVYDNWLQSTATHQDNNLVHVCSHCTGNTVTCSLEYGTIFTYVSSRADTCLKIYRSECTDIFVLATCVIFNNLPYPSVVSLQVH
jgi:hypothetical protein